MTPRRKRHLTYITIGVFFFLGGVEYAVILPTVWLYLDQKFHAQKSVLGFVLSAFSLAGLLAAPLMGRWSDKTKNTKAILIVANLFEIGGSIMYFLGINQWFLVLSRFIAGVGNGVGAAIFADLTRITSKEERTAVMSTFMAIRQLGLIIGPGFNLFLRHLHFYIGPFIVDKFTSPGLFMAVLWGLHEILAIFMYWNLPKLKLQEDLEAEQLRSRLQASIQAGQEPSSISSPGLDQLYDIAAIQQTPVSTDVVIKSTSKVINRRSSMPKSPPRTIQKQNSDPTGSTQVSSDEYIENAEHLMAMTPGTTTPSMYDIHSPQRHANKANNHSGHSNYDGLLPLEDSMSFTSDHFSQESIPQVQLNGGPLCGESETQKPETSTWTFRYYYNELMREEIIALLVTVFVAFFNQVALETMVTPLTQKLLNWGELENSILYCIAGVEIIIVFIVIRCLSRRFHDSTLLLMGFIVEAATVGFLVWYTPQCIPGDVNRNLPGLIVGIFFDVFSLPFLIVCSTSLYSKITREETQGFAQGIRRVFVGFGTILGPLWAGGLMANSTQLYIMLGVMMGINIIAMVLLCLSFKYLRYEESSVEEDTLNASRSINSGSSEERQSLLG